MTQTEISLKMIFDRWYASLANADKMLGVLSDTDLLREIAPGKNRGIYILGHLIAVHDDMLVLLDMGERRYPELQDAFLKSPDKAVASIPDAATLRRYWTEQCVLMKECCDRLTTDDWFGRHTAVAAEDFALEPHRNKLNIIITRTSHLQYHLGQLALLKP